MGIEQLSIFVENKPGKLVEVIEAFGKANLDLRALSIAETADFGVLRVIVDRPDAAFKMLTEAGYVVKSTQVLPVAIDDKPGALGKLLRVLSDDGISVEYVYAFVAHGDGKAFVIVRVENNETATQTLAKAGIDVAVEKEIFNT
jgi:hypothetical protein